MLQGNIRRYLRHGTLPQLRVFEASARLGSFTRAAQELHMAQPTASVQIRKLTETVGLALFEQVGNRIYLTDAGRRLYEGCRHVFEAFEALEHNLCDMRELKSGELRLAVSSCCKYLAPRMLGEFTRLHPGVVASLEIGNHEQLAQRLLRNADDLYIFAEAPPAGDVVAQALLPNPFVVFARADHALARKRRIPFARLAQEPFLLREAGSGTREQALAIFQRHEAVPAVRMQLGTDEAIREAIIAGLGVSILPRYTLALEAADARLACLDVEGFPVENHWHLAYGQGKQLSAAARAFLDFARTEARALAADATRVASAPGSAPSPRPM